MRASVFASGFARSISKHWRPGAGKHQNLDIYYDPNFAQLLEIWGIDNAWREIQFLLGDRRGKVLDVACGTGRTHDFLSRFSELEYYGCDISSFLIEKAIARGIASDRVSIQDATKMTYEDRSFDYIFSIGSLEHFTVEGIKATLAECARVSRGINFHQIPVSRSGFDEGWVSPYQSYWNNSERWWRGLFREAFGPDVWVLESRWDDLISRGVWFICGSKDYFIP